ncbi:MAG: response regulator transcription factor [Phycisphaerales bacterium]|nr:response regulator transcription factor [Phycisphaerales bacterium]
MVRPSVLIVEDEADIAKLMQFHLEREGYSARIAHSGSAALSALEQQRPDLVILDIMLPDLDGLEVCRRLKRDVASRDVPIIMVSARGEESDVVVGLELGAEDYITKPFSPRVLIARVKAVMRRKETDTSGQISLAGGEVVIDPARHALKIFGQDVELTLTQYRLLHYLASRPGFVRTRDQIVAAVRGEDAVLSSRAIDVHVAALRQKLGDMGGMIETVRGVGYRLSDSRSSQVV